MMKSTSEHGSWSRGEGSRWVVGVRAFTPFALAFAVLVSTLASVPVSAFAQSSPLAVELQAGITHPADAFRDGLPQLDDPTGDLGFGARLVYRGGGGLGFHVGFSQLRFGCGGARCPGDEDIVSTGWELGLRWTFDAGAIEPFLQVAPFFTRVEARTDRSPEGSGEVSDLAVGGEAGLGVAIPIAERFAIRPMVRYQAVDADFPSTGVLRLRHLFFEAGLGFGF